MTKVRRVSDGEDNTVRATDRHIPEYTNPQWVDFFKQARPEGFKSTSSAIHDQLNIKTPPPYQPPQADDSRFTSREPTNSERHMAESREKYLQNLHREREIVQRGKREHPKDWEQWEAECFLRNARER